MPLTHHYQHSNPLDDPDLTITVSGIPVTDSEDLIKKAEELISCLGNEVSSKVNVSGATRLPSRLTNKPALVKISFVNLQQKILVLRNKRKLKDTEHYKQVYINNSKSRVERLIENNARALLRNLPRGHSLRVDANGQIKPRDTQRQEQQQPTGNI